MDRPSAADPGAGEITAQGYPVAPQISAILMPTTGVIIIRGYDPALTVTVPRRGVSVTYGRGNAAIIERQENTAVIARQKNEVA